MSIFKENEFSIDDLLTSFESHDLETKAEATTEAIAIKDDFLSLSTLCEIEEETKPVEIAPRRRGRPKGSTNSKQPIKRKARVKGDAPDYSMVDASIVPENIMDDLKMTIYSYQAQASGLIIDFLKLFYILEPTVDETDYILALHCNFAHKINANIPDNLKDKAEKKAKSKKKTRKPVGDGTCFNTCLEIYIKLKHPGISDTKIYKMKCSSTTGQIQIPGGRLEEKEDCRAVVNIFLDHLKKHNICDPNAEIVSDKVSMKNYKTKINIVPGLDLYTHKLSRYFYNIEHDEFDEFEGTYIEPPFKIREAKNPDEFPRTSFKFQYGPNKKKDSFRVEIFNNEKKINIGRINFKGTKVHEYALQAYEYISEVIRENWTVFITKQSVISYQSSDESDSDSDSDSD